MEESVPNQNRPVIKYVGLFALAYFFFLGLISILLLLAREYMTGMFYSIATFGAGSSVAGWFVKENSRLPINIEKRRIIIGTFLCVIVVNSMVGWRYIIYDHDYTFITLTISSLAILWYIFGPMSKSIFEKRNK